MIHYDLTLFCFMLVVCSCKSDIPILVVFCKWYFAFIGMSGFLVWCHCGFGRVSPPSFPKHFPCEARIDHSSE